MNLFPNILNKYIKLIIDIFDKMEIFIYKSKYFINMTFRQ